MTFRPGPLNQMAVNDLNDMQRVLRRLWPGRIRAETPLYLRDDATGLSLAIDFNSIAATVNVPFLVQISAPAYVSGNICWTWAEWGMDNSTGDNFLLPEGLSGDPIDGPYMQEINGNFVTWPTLVLARYRGNFDGQDIYEFDRCCSALANWGSGIIGSLTCAGEGTVTNAYTGTASPALQVLTCAGVGSDFAGSGTPSLVALTCAGSGTFTGHYTGTATPSLLALTSSASGTFTGVYTGTASPALQVLTCAGTGTFTAPVPTVTSVSPAGGSTAGGGTISITGTGFTGVTAVTFGLTPATSFTFNSDTSITATSPAGSAGTVDITVTTPAGTSVTGSPDQFVYTSPTQVFTSSTTYTIPPGCTGQTVSCTGSGGNGHIGSAGSSGGGGGGGAFAAANLTASVGATLTISVVAGTYWISNTGIAPVSSSQGVLAVPGIVGSPITGGTGGAAGSCIGTTTFSGGTGGAGAPGVNTGGGGGGGAGTQSGAGATGGAASGATGGTGASGGGGNGGTTPGSPNGANATGVGYGGGGGAWSSGTAGSGSAGQAEIVLSF